jgi:serine/threonine protein kinase
VKIGDFGLSRVVHRQAGNTLAGGPLTSANLTANLGTPSYMAPELLTKAISRNGKRASIHIDGEAADVYAFGVIMNAMWTKQGGPLIPHSSHTHPTLIPHSSHTANLFSLHQHRTSMCFTTSRASKI